MKKIWILLLLPLFLARNCFAGEATLSWDPPTTNVDGSPLTDLGGYKIYYGIASGSYTTSIDVGNTVSYTVTNLIAETTYYFAATAYDTLYNESGYSNEVSKISSISPTIPTPTGIRLAWSGGTITVSWDKPNYGNIAGYQVSRGPTPTLFNAIYDVPGVSGNILLPRGSVRLLRQHRNGINRHSLCHGCCRYDPAGGCVRFY